MAQVTTAGRATRPSADATRERILAAALDLFSELSFDGATTREIAARAGVTQPLLNYHFSSKDELWRAAVDGLFAELDRGARRPAPTGLRGVDDADRGEAAGPRVRLLLRRRTRSCTASSPRSARPTARAWTGWSSATSAPGTSRPTALFARLVEAGHVPDIPVAHLYYILTGAGPTMFVLAPECRRLAGSTPGARRGRGPRRRRDLAPLRR